MIEETFDDYWKTANGTKPAPDLYHRSLTKKPRARVHVEKDKTEEYSVKLWVIYCDCCDMTDFSDRRFYERNGVMRFAVRYYSYEYALKSARWHVRRHQLGWIKPNIVYGGMTHEVAGL